jgi:hypothetical protein
LNDAPEADFGHRGEVFSPAIWRSTLMLHRVATRIDNRKKVK